MAATAEIRKPMNLVPTLGLVTKPRPFQAPFGAFADGSKNFWLDGQRCSTPPGFDRLTTTRPNAHTTKLSGQFWRGNVAHASNVMARTDTTQTMELIIRVDRLNDYQMLGYKGQGEAVGAVGTLGKFDWCFYITWYGAIVYSATDSGGLLVVTNTILADGDGKPIGPGNWYSIAIVDDAAAAAGARHKIYLQRIGSSNQAVANATAIASTTSTDDVFFGAAPIDVGSTPSSASKSRDRYAQHQFQGIIQEIRLWDIARSAADIKTDHASEIATNAANLIGLYRLTGSGTDTYFVNPDVGTVGDGTGQMPRLELEQRDATWVDNGHVLGQPITGYDYSLAVNGRNNGLTVPDSYRYRKQTVDEDGVLESPSNFYINTRLRTGRLKNRSCVAHWTHIPDDAFGSIIARQATGSTTSGDAVAGAGEEFTIYIEEVDVGAGVYEFMAVVGYETSVPTFRIARVVSNTGGLVANTEYDMTVSFFGAGGIRIEVGASADQSQTFAGTFTGLRGTPNTPEGSFRKYALTFGNSIYRSRFLFGRESDPNYFDVEYDYSKSWDGVFGHVIIGSLTTTASNLAGLFGSDTMHHIFRNATKITKDFVNSLAGQVYSAWTFDQGKGGNIKDIGLNGTTIPFRVDSGHTWGASGITTAAREKILGIFEHQYSDLPVSVARIVCIAGGSAYTLNVSSGALTFVADGFRNDLGKRVSFAKSGDAIVMCSGSPGGNYQLLKDTIVKLSIEEPAGLLPWGLAGQMDPTSGLKKGQFTAEQTQDAALQEGSYGLALAYYNKDLDKWSRLVPFAMAPILYGRANIVIGPDAEINQAHAKLPTIVSGANGVEPFGIASASGAKHVTVKSYITSETTAKAKKVHLSLGSTIHSHPFILDSSDATKEEWAITFEAFAPRVWCELLPKGRLSVNCRFIGSTSTITLTDVGTSVVSNDWNSGGAGTITATGSGVTSHGIKIPRSFDPQVTHVGIFRTVAGGDVYRLVDTMANGDDKSFTINQPDSQLGGFTLDPSIGPVPSVRLVTDFGSRMFYILDDLAEEAIYPSQPGLPWGVRTGDVVFLKEGASNPITGIARTEQTLTVFKRDELFVITETTSPDFPFEINLRIADEGCVAPFGIINIASAFHFPALRGFSRYDTSSLVGLSNLIEPTYRSAISAAAKDMTEGVYDRKNRMALWFVASGNSYDESEQPILDQVIAWDAEAKRDDNGDYFGWQYLTGIYATTAAAVHDSNGNEMILFADPMGYINRWDVGTNFGLGSDTGMTTPAVDATGTPSTTQIKLAALNSGSYPEGYVGFPITCIDTSTGARETRMIVTDDKASPNSLIRLDHALSFTFDHTADTVVVASIEADWTVCDFAPFGHTNGSIFVEEELIMQPRTPSATIVHRMRGILGDGDGDTVGIGTIADDQIVTVTNGNDDYLRFLAYQDQATGSPRMPRGTHMRRRVQALGADKPFEWLGSTLVFSPRGKLKERA